MSRKSVGLAALMAAAMTVFAAEGRAEEPPSCQGTVGRASLVTCALAASPSVRAERQGVEAVEGRSLSASALFPSNPVLSLSGGRRSAGGVSAVNWYVSLAQEVEVGGQRGARRDAAHAELEAQQGRVLGAEREAVAAAYIGYFELLGAKEEVRLAEQLVAINQDIVAVTRARVEKGLTAAIDLDIAESSAVRITLAGSEARRRVATARAALASVLGLDPLAPVDAQGELSPLVGAESVATGLSAQSAQERPEVTTLRAEQRAFQRRADLYRRLRLPNPTLSLSVQNDGFNERVLGVGLAFPIPLPGSLGRSYAGEIAETEALARRTGSEVDRLRRELRLEQATALHEFTSRREQLDAFTTERVQRALRGIQTLGQEIESGRLALLGALFAQQSLVELLQAHVAARKALCLASVEVVRTAGLPPARWDR